jgi:hypothetical protein
VPGALIASDVLSDGTTTDDSGRVFGRAERRIVAGCTPLPLQKSPTARGKLFWRRRL